MSVLLLAFMSPYRGRHFRGGVLGGKSSERVRPDFSVVLYTCCYQYAISCYSYQTVQQVVRRPGGGPSLRCAARRLCTTGSIRSRKRPCTDVPEERVFRLRMLCFAVLSVPSRQSGSHRSGARAGINDRSNGCLNSDRRLFCGIGSSNKLRAWPVGLVYIVWSSRQCFASGVCALNGCAILTGHSSQVAVRKQHDRVPSAAKLDVQVEEYPQSQLEGKVCLCLKADREYERDPYEQATCHKSNLCSPCPLSTFNFESRQMTSNRRAC